MAFNPNEHLTQLRGKHGVSDYLEVKWRLVWFRDVFPLGSIATECLYQDAERAVFKATITTNAIMKDGASATGHGSEAKQDFGDYIEKAETKAVGRALAMLGFGTQFAPELNEGERIVDSPVQRKPAPPAERQQAPRPQGNVAPAQQQAPPPGNLVTEKQRNYLKGVGRAAGWSEQDLRDYALKEFAVPTLDELTRRNASFMIDGLKPPAEGETPKPHYPLEKVALAEANVAPRSDPQEANQQGMTDVPPWVDEAPPVESAHWQ